MGRCTERGGGSSAFVGCVLTAGPSVQLNGGFQTNSVPYAAAQLDTSGFWSATVHPERITIPAGLDGIYRFTGSAFASSGGWDAGWWMQLLKNAAGDGFRFAYFSGTGDASAGHVVTYHPIAAVAGDYFELLQFGNNYQFNRSVAFSCERLG